MEPKKKKPAKRTAKPGLELSLDLPLPGEEDAISSILSGWLETHGALRVSGLPIEMICGEALKMLSADGQRALLDLLKYANAKMEKGNGSSYLIAVSVLSSLRFLGEVSGGLLKRRKRRPRK